MPLRDIHGLLMTVVLEYSRAAGLSSGAQVVLRNAREALDSSLPAGLLVVGSGGKGQATFTPWIAILDPDETTSPQDGLYVVYLFSEDLRKVSLSLNQGITRLTRRLGVRAARAELRTRATTIRSQLAKDLVSGLTISIDLRSSGARQLSYEAGNVIAKTYVTRDLPLEPQLREDLRRFLSIYQRAISPRVQFAEPGGGSSESGRDEDLLRDFKPRDHSDYIAYLSAKRLTKSRRHEELIGEYGAWLARRGFAVSTEQFPKDLVVTKEGEEWLVEAKVVYMGNGTDAVRAAIGQLFTYGHLFYKGRKRPGLLALFSESVGDIYVDLLEDLGIGVVWKEDGWRGSASAASAKFSDLATTKLD
jgi:hypothetical protein